MSAIMAASDISDYFPFQDNNKYACALLNYFHQNYLKFMLGDIIAIGLLEYIRILAHFLNLDVLHKHSSNFGSRQYKKNHSM